MGVVTVRRNGWDNSDGGVPADVAVEVEAVDGPESNVAITAVRAEGGDAVAVVQNYSQRPVNEQVLFAVDEGITATCEGARAVTARAYRPSAVRGESARR